MLSALLGIFLHAVGGFAAGSFYIPLKRVRDWAWESGWLISGIAAWILLPLAVALLTVPQTFSVLREAMSTSPEAVGYTFLFGLLWGVGGLTFGLSLRYLGVALGTTIALGCCAAFGTLLPPALAGELESTFAGSNGLMVLAGLVVCFVGITVGGIAGRKREQELPEETSQKTENKPLLGLFVAIVSGVLSACFAFGLAAGKPIADLSTALGTPPLFQSSAVLVILLWGGFITNAVWCIAMNVKNKTGTDYTAASSHLLANYGWAALAGAIWYFQFMFYGMGSSYLGAAYDFASWSIHMAFIIFFGNLWGLRFKEWAGVSRSVRNLLYLSLALLVLAVVLIGVGSSL